MCSSAELQSQPLERLFLLLVGAWVCEWMSLYWPILLGTDMDGFGGRVLGQGSWGAGNLGGLRSLTQLAGRWKIVGTRP